MLEGDRTVGVVDTGGGSSAPSTVMDGGGGPLRLGVAGAVVFDSGGGNQRHRHRGWVMVTDVRVNAGECRGHLLVEQTV